MAAGFTKIGLNAHRADLLGMTAYNTVAEASMEAYQTQHEVQALLESKGYSPEQAKAKAATAAAGTFW